MFKKYLPLVPFLLLAFLVISIWKLPAATSILGILLLLASLDIAIFGIFEKHKASENPRSKITKDVLILIITILLIISLGGLAGLITNSYASPRFGMIVGFIAAMIVSFSVGYLIRKGMKLKDCRS